MLDHTEFMVLALQFDNVYPNSLLGVARKTCWQVNVFHVCPALSCQRDVLCVAGFRPGRRGPFVLAKGPKTIDAPSGLIREGGRQPEEGGPTRSAQTRPAN
jgi:hypothetical protein